MSTGTSSLLSLGFPISSHGSLSLMLRGSSGTGERPLGPLRPTQLPPTSRYGQPATRSPLKRCFGVSWMIFVDSSCALLSTTGTTSRKHVLWLPTITTHCCKTYQFTAPAKRSESTPFLSALKTSLVSSGRVKKQTFETLTRGFSVEGCSLVLVSIANSSLLC